LHKQNEQKSLGFYGVASIRKICPLLDNPCNHQGFCCYDETNWSKQMRFDEKYQLLDLKEDAEAKFFVAREIATGRQVSVFLFVGEQAGAQAQLIEQLRTMDHSLFPELIETGKNRETPYVVTQPISGFAELNAKVIKLKASTPVKPGHKQNGFAKAGVWHVPQGQKESSDKPSASATTPSKPDLAETIVAAPPAPGGFTQMFQTPAAPMGEPTVKAVPPPVPLPKQPVAPPPESVPGGFTSMFQAPVSPAGEPTVKSVPPPAPPPKQPVAPPPEPVPGGFTSMFQAPVSPAGEPTAKAVPPPAPEPVPGEFTRIFQAPAAPMGEPTQKSTVSPASPKQPAPPPAQKTGPGEFTRFFQSSPAPSGTVPIPKQPAGQGQFAQVFGGGASSPAPHGSAGQFTRIFESPASAPTQQPPRLNAPATPPPAYVPPAGEFTRVFGGPSEGILVPPPAETLPQAAPGEYTRMFSAQPAPPVEEPAPSPQALQPPEPAIAPTPNSKLPLILGGIIVLLVIVIAVLLIVMGK
jgi:hypothetical protein